MKVKWKFTVLEQFRLNLFLLLLILLLLLLLLLGTMMQRLEKVSLWSEVAGLNPDCYIKTVGEKGYSPKDGVYCPVPKCPHRTKANNSNMFLWLLDLHHVSFLGWISLQPVFSWFSMLLCLHISAPPCSPWRIVDDCGGAFTMGAIGGGVFQAIKGFRNAPAVSSKCLLSG